MEPTKHMHWRPGLGTYTYRGSESVSTELDKIIDTQAVDSIVDEVQFSIVCYDCGKHFWSRSKADSHAALTAHVLHEDNTSPYSPVYSPVTIAESPTATPASTGTQAKASSDISIPNQQDSGGSENGEYPICFNGSRYYCGSEAAKNRAKTKHMQDTELVPSSVPHGSPTSAVVSAAVRPTSPASNYGMLPSSPYWNTAPGYISPVANGATIPTSPCPTIEQTTNRGLLATSPLYGGVSPTSTDRLTNSKSSHAMDPFIERVSLHLIPNTEFEVSHPASDDNLRRSSEHSPSPPGSEWLPAHGLPPYMNTDKQTVFTPTTSRSVSSNRSSATLEHPLVNFPHGLSDRIFFIVTPSGNRKRPGYIMGLAEAQNAVTFRAGVRRRLESQGEQVGSREIIAHIPWLSVPVYADSDEDHYHMLMTIKFWPEWQNTNWNTCCHVCVTIEDEEKGKGKDELQQQMSSTSED